MVADIWISDIQYYLKKKTITVLFIVSCSCGKYTKRNDNIARAFAKKITGTVIAADGLTSYSSSYVKSGGSGWYAYKFTNYGSTFSCVKLGYTKLTIKQMLSCVGVR